ncbi:MAG TPA: outer membrane lipoprotein-sorting protein [Verrucomicrobiae bacterium]|nr:outer membrane lipoprotein-sorting protein [Verrucomicrobiae bacterium]
MNAFRAWLILSLLLVALSARAVTTNDPVTAEREGRELAKQLRNAKPDGNLTNSGTILILASRKQRSTIQFHSRVIVTETNWTSYYEAMNGTNNLLTFSVEHRPDAPSIYRLNCTNQLAPNQTALPFAGSDFWLVDLGLEFFHWPVQLLTRRELERGESCSVLESRNPAAPPGSYSRVVSYVDNDTGGIVRADAFDAKGKLLKQFFPTSFEKVNGQWHLQKMEMENLQTGSRSILTFDLK